MDENGLSLFLFTRLRQESPAEGAALAETRPGGAVEVEGFVGAGAVGATLSPDETRTTGVGTRTTTRDLSKRTVRLATGDAVTVGDLTGGVTPGVADADFSSGDRSCEKSTSSN